jgi:hypothetical protein
MIINNPAHRNAIADIRAKFLQSKMFHMDVADLTSKHFTEALDFLGEQSEENQIKIDSFNERGGVMGLHDFAEMLNEDSIPVLIAGEPYPAGDVLLKVDPDRLEYLHAEYLNNDLCHDVPEYQLLIFERRLWNQLLKQVVALFNVWRRYETELAETEPEDRTPEWRLLCEGNLLYVKEHIDWMKNVEQL